jgi:hypothetical protein
VALSYLSQALPDFRGDLPEWSYQQAFHSKALRGLEMLPGLVKTAAPALAGGTARVIPLDPAPSPRGHKGSYSPHSSRGTTLCGSVVCW